jgi:hypothetical protein
LRLAGGASYNSLTLREEVPMAQKKSSIHIKKANQGTYTARAKSQGNSVQQQARKDLANPNVSPKIKKRANFARNAKKWGK